MFTNRNLLSYVTIAAAVAVASLLSACNDDDSSVSAPDELRSETYNYAFNEGQAIGDDGTAYRGEHERNIMAQLMIEEREDGNANVTVQLENTLDGETYPVHAHDMADPATTPNNTPYNETPNGDVFATGIEGTGGSASFTNETSITYDDLINEYEGFFVVHDPLQNLNTADLTTYLTLGVFAQNLGAGESSLRSESYSYGFNEGQLLDDPATAYDGEGEGDHPRNLSAELIIEERGTGMANVTVVLNNTVDGEDYPVHAHDMADPATTPNGTPYNETPNGNVFAGAITGNGDTAMMTNETAISYTELVAEYEAFLVVHDPTQQLTTVDLTTYLVLGVFAQDLDAVEPNLRSESYMYDFNEGQLLDDMGTAYDGSHDRNLTAMLTLNEQIDGSTELVVTLNNTVDGEQYAVHSHDAADPAVTPNGTPYNETPNGNVFATGIEGTGGEATASNMSTLSFNDLTRDYDGFFVVHDPLQQISTVDLTTYLILGATAR
jgi:phage terminase large subunit-like protein